MRLIILGSAGVGVIPKPGCECKVCKEAKERGIPHARLTQSSMFIEDIRLLFDTPLTVPIALSKGDKKGRSYRSYSLAPGPYFGDKCY